MNIAMTFAEASGIKAYRNLVKDMTALQLWYITNVIKVKKENFAVLLNHYSRIYTYSNAYHKDVPAERNPDWQEIVAKLKENWLKVGNENFPNSSWSILQEYIEPKIVPNINKAKKDLAKSFYGFSYEFHHEYFGPAKPEFLTLHFRNYFCPDTPFHHISKLIEGLLKVIEHALQERPDINHIQCASWLNNIKSFNQLFPDAWIENSQECPIGGNLGWWGQFIDRKNQLHKKNVAKFKQTKKFLYPNLHCQCKIQDLKQHLEQFQQSSQANKSQ